ncbi:uncharacterized protein LOC120355554 [Nilaparvata lugens]|uniref:uncharacterized protein LOC120355554 n=1 Tax=Nilaparvata lugens TaxID=108931 RepID=UPI00193E61B7|nr:uncharacterized protein LOC120355554 [Nilaparvata lugens]XP_039300040.1 uncharacterized protein LOC120355554 [Nilaparvata lugens]
MGDIYNTMESRKDDLSVQLSTSSLQLPMGDGGGGGGYMGVGMGDAMNRPSPPLALFYPQLGYEIHPFLLSQHHAHARHPNMAATPFEEADDASHLLDNEHAVFGAPNMLEDPLRTPKHKPVKRKPIETPYPVEPCAADSNADYAIKNRKIFICKLCEKTFKFQTSLLRHNNKVHISKYQCQTCHRVFSRQAYLDVHTSKQGSSCYLGNYSNAKPRSKLNKLPPPPPLPQQQQLQQ